jgi:glycine/D-amino acid oxidase-like deaminating enzyme
VGSQVSGSRPYDVAVVGGGIIGCACAFNLQRAGLGVLLIDRGVPSEAASWGNAGHFAYEQVLPLATPELWARMPRLLLATDSPLRIPLSSFWTLGPWLARFAWNTRPSQVERARRALASLLAPAPAAWQRLAAAAHLTDWIRAGPVVLVARNEAALVSKRRAIEVYRRHGIAIDEISPPEARQIEPLIRPDVAGAFVYRRGQYTTDPGRLTRRLKEAYVEAGGGLVAEEVHRLELPGDGTVKLGSWVARQCVVAAGIGSREILKSIGIDIPLAAERGYHIMVPYVEGQPTVRTPLIGAKPEFVITPMDEGVRLAGTVELVRESVPPRWRRALMLKALADQIVQPFGEPSDGSKWIGCRPSLPDSLPAIGRVARAPNVIAAFGHQHLGLTMAAVTGEIVSAVVQGKEAPVPTAPFAVERFVTLRKGSRPDKAPRTGHR